MVWVCNIAIEHIAEKELLETVSDLRRIVTLFIAFGHCKQ